MSQNDSGLTEEQLANIAANAAQEAISQALGDGEGADNAHHTMLPTGGYGQTDCGPLHGRI
jgi:hypothetical protein